MLRHDCGRDLPREIAIRLGRRIRPVVADRDPDRPAFRDGVDPQLPGRGAALEDVERFLQEIDQDELDLCPIDLHRRKVIGDLDAQLERARRQPVGMEGQGCVDEGSDGGRLAFGRPFPEEVEQRMDELASPCRLPGEQLRLLAHVVGQPRIRPQQLGEPDDRRERVVQLVRDARHQPGHGVELLRPDRLVGDRPDPGATVGGVVHGGILRAPTPGPTPRPGGRPLSWPLTEEERLLQQTAREFAQREVAPSAIERDEAERFDRAIFGRMGELGLTAAPIPESAGGAGFSYLGWSLVMEELGAADMATAVTLSVHILSQLPVVAWGSPEQVGTWLPPMLSGEALGAFALTEPHAGSDASAIRTRATRDGDTYRLTGTKIWISNAPEADRYLVFATLDPGAGPSGIAAFLVEKGMPGFRFGAHEKKMGIRACPAAELVFEDAVVPAANRLGEEGDGYRIALSSLAEGRISIAAACVGIARSALEQAAAYLRERRAFGAPLSEQQGLRFMLAEMARDVEAARALTRQAAAAKDRGDALAVPSSLAKWTASDTAMRVATDAVQLFGASGYSRETGIERLMRDAKGAQIYEGTNQIHRLIVADELLGRSG